jgi:protein phosphatase
VIVRALGMKESVKVDTFLEQPRPGDIFLLCTDGLSGEVPDPQIQEIMLRHGKNLQPMCQELIDTAKKNGGSDNITVILVRNP